MDLLSKQMTDKLPSDIEGLKSSFAKLESVIAQTSEYVGDVLVRPSPLSHLPGCLRGWLTGCVG